MGFNNDEFKITTTNLELEGWTQKDSGGITTYWYNGEKKSYTEYKTAIITTNGVKIDNNGYFYNDAYYIINDDGSYTYAGGDESTYQLLLSSKQWDADDIAAYRAQLEEEARKEREEQEEADRKAYEALVNANRRNIVDGMQNFRDMLDLLDAKFCKDRAVYTMYFKMVLTPNNKVGEETLVDTTSSDWLENNLISFTHNMNGSGEANTFTLDILFKPDDRNFKSINALEEKLLAACAIYNSDVDLKTEEEIYSNCKIQYGYADNMDMRSPTYYGTIMEYDSKIENGNLRYTIKGYCGLYSAKEYRIAPKSEYLTTADGTEIDNPLLYISRIFEVEFKHNKLYDVEFLNIDLSKVKYPGEDYKQFEQKNIFQVIKDILAGCMTESQYNAMSGISEDDKSNNDVKVKDFLPNQKQIFSYFIDNKESEEGGKYGTVVIYKMESVYGEENATKTPETIPADCDIEFGWFAPTSNAFNHVVKDWHPEYKGAVLMALATTFVKGTDKYYTMTNNGDVIPITGLGAARLGVDDSNRNEVILSAIQEYDNWAFVTQYPYSASMTLLGVPCEVPMTGKIKVSARMGTELHHSSGIYQVLGKTDRISSAGFFTELKLFKFVAGFDPKYTEIKPDGEFEQSIKNEGEYLGNNWYFYNDMYHYIDNNGYVTSGDESFYNSASGWM